VETGWDSLLSHPGSCPADGVHLKPRKPSLGCQGDSKCESPGRGSPWRLQTRREKACFSHEAPQPGEKRRLVAKSLFR